MQQFLLTVGEFWFWTAIAVSLALPTILLIRWAIEEPKAQHRDQRPRFESDPETPADYLTGSDREPGL